LKIYMSIGDNSIHFPYNSIDSNSAIRATVFRALSQLETQVRRSSLYLVSSTSCSSPFIDSESTAVLIFNEEVIASFEGINPNGPSIVHTSDLAAVFWTVGIVSSILNI
jgi:hypothetical protein